MNLLSDCSWTLSWQEQLWRFSILQCLYCIYYIIVYFKSWWNSAGFLYISSFFLISRRDHIEFIVSFYQYLAETAAVLSRLFCYHYYQTVFCLCFTSSCFLLFSFWETNMWSWMSCMFPIEFSSLFYLIFKHVWFF